MSPEQILGDTVDARSDLFSLGVILYRMLTGTRPFEREGDPKAGRGGAERLRRDAPVPFRERAPDVPRPLERTVMKLLQKNPEDRHASAREVAEELAAFLRSFSGASPQRLVVAALAEAGYVKEEGTRRAKPHVARRSQLALPSVRTTWLGFAGIGAAFLLFAGLSEVLARDSRTVRAAGSKPLELAPEQSGSLRVLATPWAEVAVDGQHVDTTPFARAIPLPPGPHFVSLTHPNAKPENRQIVIRANEVVTVDVTLDLGEGTDAGAADAQADARADASRTPAPTGSEKPAFPPETHPVP
jgi:serine/threonine-protein kinase